MHVIDGGFLLHKVIWQKNDTIELIIEKYLSFIRTHFSNNSCIVFDGYPENENSTTSTKAAERLRRKNYSSVPSFNIEPHTKITVLQQQFLSNDKNKNELIQQLSRALRFEGYTIKQADEDADSLIIRSAIEIAERSEVINAATGVAEPSKNVVIVGQDIDLLVLLHQLYSGEPNIYFLKPDAGVTRCIHHVVLSMIIIFQLLVFYIVLPAVIPRLLSREKAKKQRFKHLLKPPS